MNLDRVYTISHRLRGNQQDAEALTCMTLVEAWKLLDKIRNDVPFKLWLEGLNVHLALQDLRDTKTENTKRSFFKKRKIKVKEPDHKISELDAEICKLPELERTVFVLSKIENYSPDELSGMMDISPDQIKEKLENSESLLIKAEFIQTREMLNEVLANHTGQSKDKVAEEVCFPRATMSARHHRLLDKRRARTTVLRGQQASR